jgi:hypothetical protein
VDRRRDERGLILHCTALCTAQHSALHCTLIPNSAEQVLVPNHSARTVSCSSSGSSWIMRSSPRFFCCVKTSIQQRSSKASGYSDEIREASSLPRGKSSDIANSATWSTGLYGTKLWSFVPRKSGVEHSSTYRILPHPASRTPGWALYRQRSFSPRTRYSVSG